jgi:hypothetical protein
MQLFTQMHATPCPQLIDNANVVAPIIVNMQRFHNVDEKALKVLNRPPHARICPLSNPPLPSLPQLNFFFRKRRNEDNVNTANTVRQTQELI